MLLVPVSVLLSGSPAQVVSSRVVVLVKVSLWWRVLWSCKWEWNGIESRSSSAGSSSVSEQQSSTPGASVSVRCGAFVGVLVGTTVDGVGAVESC